MESNSFSLAQLQNWMQGMLVHHVPLDNSNAEMPPVMVAQIVNASQRLSAVRHLDIYRYSYIARLRACMQTQFSALAYALGMELFELFADQYLDAYPSGSYTLNTLGEKFAAFLAETRPDADQEIKETWPDFMIELAGFEYTLSVIFDEYADEQQHITISGEIPDEQLQLAPVFQLFQHKHPICDYYLAFSQGKGPELPLPQESYCVVTRHNYKLGLFTIRAAQYYFLKTMQEAHLIKDATHNFLEAFGFSREAFEKLWPVWKKSFIESGFLVAFKDK